MVSPPRSPGSDTALFKPCFRPRPCRSMAGSISCLLPWWPCCTSTTWPLRRSERKSYGDRYATNSSHPTKPAYLAAPPQAKAEHDYFFRHVALQRGLRDVFLLGRTESKGRSVLGRDR